MKITYVFFCVLCLAFSLDASSQTNGCGSGWNTYLVPDRLPLSSCEFKSACDVHDICYGKCEGLKPSDRPPQCEYLRCRKGGDLVGSDTCINVKYVRLEKAANERKGQCDAKFYNNLVSTNPNRPVCRVFAAIYGKAVELLAGGAFIGIGATLSGGLSEAQVDRSLAAINELLTSLSPDQLAAYEKALSEGKVAIDWSKELAFSKQRLLYNP